MMMEPDPTRRMDLRSVRLGMRGGARRVQRTKFVYKGCKAGSNELFVTIFGEGEGRMELRNERDFFERRGGQRSCADRGVPKWSLGTRGICPQFTLKEAFPMHQGQSPTI